MSHTSIVIENPYVIDILALENFNSLIIGLGKTFIILIPDQDDIWIF